MIPLEMELNPPPLLTDFTTCYCQVKNYRRVFFSQFPSFLQIVNLSYDKLR